MREGHSHRKLRQQFRAATDLPPQPSLDDAVAAVSRICGKSIRIHYVAMRHPFTGGLFHADTELIMLVDKVSPPRLLQLCVIAHELAHVYLGHDPDVHGHDVSEEELLRSLLPSLNPAVARMMLGRTYFDSHGPHHTDSDTPPEREAEILGRTIVGLIVTRETSAESASLNSALRHRGTGV
ncbi:hypothetical protein [Streptomyces sp. NPDC059003]|uniref:hypothetical protein n=1 Tax=Streptomyces sp. NPDC059003 TaxID=3346691 RepID=UPI0036B0AF47